MTDRDDLGAEVLRELVRIRRLLQDCCGGATASLIDPATAPDTAIEGNGNSHCTIGQICSQLEDVTELLLYWDAKLETLRTKFCTLVDEVGECCEISVTCDGLDTTDKPGADSFPPN